MKEALKVFTHVYVEMDPGDALFFHCNLLHSRDVTKIRKVDQTRSFIWVKLKPKFYAVYVVNPTKLYNFGQMF